MMIYCSHTQKTFTQNSNYYTCRVCMAGWYGRDHVPMVVIGFTDERDVIEYNTHKRNYSTERCEQCKDIVVNTHQWCNVKLNLKRLWKRIRRKHVQHS